MPNGRLIAVILGLSLALGVGLWRVARPTSAAAPAPAGGVAAPQRIVCLSPPLTEVLFALGAGPLLVGDSDFCNYPPAAQKLPRCGAQINPNFERLTRLRPDLVLIQGEHEKVRAWCESRGQRYWGHRLDSLADVEETIRQLGPLVGRTAAATALADRLAHDLAAVRTAAAAHPPVPVFVCIGRQPGRIADLTTCGPGSFVDEVVTLAGGHNVFSDAHSLYPQPAIEALTARNPEVILDLEPGFGGSHEIAKLRSEWQVLSAVNAVKHQRVEVVVDDDVLIPGPRIATVARRLMLLLQPPPSPLGGRPTANQPPSP